MASCRLHIHQGKVVKPVVLFSLALRIIGAWTLVSGLEFVVSWFDVRMGLSQMTNYQATAFINQAIAHVVIAMVLLTFAPYFASRCYPARSVDPEA
jgi:hypothetical protein